MASRLGPRANRVYESLRRRITGGELPPGAKLPCSGYFLHPVVESDVAPGGAARAASQYRPTIPG
jgi:Bacterial regulatory proteins, gntR family